MVKEGTYIIDVGTTRIEEKLTGDVDFVNVIKKQTVHQFLVELDQ